MSNPLSGGSFAGFLDVLAWIWVVSLALVVLFLLGKGLMESDTVRVTIGFVGVALISVWAAGRLLPEDH